jgi:hypothetical protein
MNNICNILNIFIFMSHYFTQLPRPRDFSHQRGRQPTITWYCYSLVDGICRHKVAFLKWFLQPGKQCNHMDRGLRNNKGVPAFQNLSSAHHIGDICCFILEENMLHSNSCSCFWHSAGCIMSYRIMQNGDRRGNGWSRISIQQVKISLSLTFRMP